MKRNFILPIFLSLCAILAFGEEKKDEVKATETMFVIADFEDTSIDVKTKQDGGPRNPDDPPYLRMYNGSVSPINVEFSSEEKHEGRHSIRVTTQTTDWSGVEMVVPDGKGDWRFLRFLKMWIMGGKTDGEVKVVIEDSEQEQLTFSIYDDFKGWKQVSIPISGFKSRTDWQSNDAKINQKIDYPVKFLHFFTTNRGDFTLYYDSITVTDEGRKKTNPDEPEEFVERIKTLYPVKSFTSDYNLAFGAAVTIPELRVPDIANALSKEFESLTPGNEMKFASIKKDRDGWNFAPADELVEFAMENKMKARGHTLVWHSSVPEWLDKGTWTKKELLDLLAEYITTVVKRYKGKVYCWDVVNEVFEENGDYRGKGSSLWYRICGDEYIEKAFVWAHDADPGAKLFINDYNIEPVNKKSTGLYDSVKKLLAKKIPIHGVGMQMHLIEESPPNMISVYENVKRFIDLGLEVQFTEMDVRIKNPVTERKLEHQAEIYRDIINIALNAEKVTNITTWGVSDASTWITQFFPGYGSPLLFDKNFNPKPAYYAVEIALQTGPVKIGGEPDYTGRHFSSPFKAVSLEKAPKIDGVIAAGEWSKAIIYPFAYNWQNPSDQRLPDKKDFDGSFRLAYADNVLYCAVARKDDISVTNKKDPKDNDNLCVSFGIDDEVVVLRSVAGKDFEKNEYRGKRKAVWSKDRSLLELSVELPPGSTGGKILGFNISITDNDGKPGKISYISPIPWGGSGAKDTVLGEAELVFGDSASRLGRAHFIPWFSALKAASVPTIDGKVQSGEWEKGIVYGLSYNQLGEKDLSPPAQADLYADWRVLYAGNVLYGMLRRVDDKTVTGGSDQSVNDYVEITIDSNDVFVQLMATVGSDFGMSSYKGKSKAAWSAKGDLVEFSIELPIENAEGAVCGWDIALFDTDGAKSASKKLYPVPGTDASWQAEELPELMFK